MPIDYRESVLTFVRTRGPSLPTQVGKHIGMDSMLAGALLAELTEKGTLRISHLKVGGSPLYFAPGQEGELVKFAQHLNEKEREAAQLLSQHQVLRDIQLPPPIRVALRQLQDFAVPLDVTFNNQKERFWKWFALPDEDAKHGIRQMLEPPKPVEQRVEQRQVEKPRQEPRTEQPQPAQQLARPHKPRAKPAPKVQPQQAPLSSFSPGTSTASGTAPSPANQAASSAQSPSAQSSPQSVVQSQQEQATADAQKSAVSLQADPTDPFSLQLHAFFVRNNIKILEQTCVKKKAEYDFVLMLPSTVGELLYYCKAKSKKTVNEGDVSAAFVQGQIRKLPVLFVSPGELAKKAKDLAMRELLSLTYKRLEG